MNGLFADTSFFVALLNERDEHHALAERLSQDLGTQVVTSHWVLLELANFFAASRHRELVPQFIDSFFKDSAVENVAADGAAWQRGLALYHSRHDKTWSLTDCLSFQIMWDRSIEQALTADHHFEQAGFEILLKKPTP